jgi:hypothetical protein
MTIKNKTSLMMAGVLAVFAAFMWSCDKDEDPSLDDLRDDKISYLEDSLRISDSLRRINAAGVVNYAITVVSGSTSSLFKNDEFDGGRTNATKSALSGAVVTISQFGKTMTDTTDASGMVVFNGFFRTSVNVTIKKEGFTSVSYISLVNMNDQTENSGIYSVGNIIPIFETSGDNTSTITGRATIQTNLTNKSRELVPDGTKVTASIDASNGSDFAWMFLTNDLEAFGETPDGEVVILIGQILEASYEGNFIGTVEAGEYSITVPSAVNGLPLVLDYSDVAADQTLFETAGVIPGDRTATYRTIFSPYSGATSTIPAASGVTIAFESFTTAATATAVISANAGTLDRINVTNGGSNYIAATPPVVEIIGGGGTGALATATVGANGKVTGINITNAGAGYTSAPTVNIISGAGATAAAGLQVDGVVTGVSMTNSGFGYTSAPAVTFSAPGGTGTTATGTAIVDGSGRVTGITITSGGSGYTANPTVTIAAAPAGGTNATATGIYSGQSVAQVSVTSGGANYTYAPTVTFSAPQRSTGTRATGTAVIDPSTRQVIGINITSPGSGYTAAPTVTMEAGSGATAQVFLTGGSVISANITSQGSGYAYAPTVTITGGGGQGATATAILADGKVVGLNITSGGTGYTSAPTITFTTGDNAVAYATVSNGAVSAITVSDGGRNFNGVPRVVITSTTGGGATGTATVANGAITGVSVGTGGTGYLEGNVPGTAESFSSTKGFYIYTRPGVDYINDLHYGTGLRQPN